MKQIFTFLTIVAVTLSFSSCSSDDNNDSTGITVKINGVSKKFKNIEVTEEVYEDYSDYVITAEQSDDLTKTIEISLGKDLTGPDSIYYIQYYDGAEFYQSSDADINANVTESSNTRIKATFSSTLSVNEGSGTVIISGGVIDIKP